MTSAKPFAPDIGLPHDGNLSGDVLSAVTTVAPDAGMVPQELAAVAAVALAEEPPPTDAIRGPVPLVVPAVRFPEVGEEYLGFQLLAELGSGAMGRVYLCRQLGLAGRLVVLKIGTSLSPESEKLARLEHPNVVPIHSFHRDGPLQALCMPYRGPLTLAHVIDRLRSEHLPTLTGRTLSTVISRCRQLLDPEVNPTRVAGSVPTRTTRPADAPRAAPALAPGATALRPFERLTGLSYVDAVLAIGRDLASGLAFAHSHSIVHSDLKPANVLLDDDGRPLLIDFSVAYDRAAGRALRIGGTQPYMSPEQLQAFRLRVAEFDERSDLYALGVILYELLTGRVPFEGNPDSTATGLDREVAARYLEPPPIRKLNPKVPPAVESIIRKCLAPNPVDRYQTAEQLREDLARQLARRPLRFAPNQSARELVGKWGRRNRWLLAAAAALVVCAATAAGASAYNARRTAEMTRLEFLASADAAEPDVREALFALAQPDDPVLRDLGREAARRALDRYRAGGDEGWIDRAAAVSLSPESLARARETVSGLMLLLATADTREARRTPPGPQREELLRRAGEWSRRAERTHPDPDVCRAIWVQRSDIARQAGDLAGAERLAARAIAAPRVSPRETVLEARALMAQGRYHTARGLLREATDRDPKNFWAWFYLGQCCAAVEEHREALRAYDIAVTHHPDFYATYFNRGLVKIRLKDAEAEADFDRAIAARPDWADAHLNRAVARERGGRYDPALADLNRALQLGFSPTQVYLVRARVHEAMGKKAEAAADLALVMKAKPTDLRGWLARALARTKSDLLGALADYREALRLDPDLPVALQGTAGVLSRLGRTREAEEVLTRLIEVSPDSPDAWSGRGVLRARLGDRTGALADAREALRLSRLPRTVYQVAGIHALFAATHPEDRREALALLAHALRAGFGLDLLDIDPELDRLRNDPEFKTTVDAARAYVANR